MVIGAKPNTAGPLFNSLHSILHLEYAALGAPCDAVGVVEVTIHRDDANRGKGRKPSKSEGRKGERNGDSLQKKERNVPCHPSSGERDQTLTHTHKLTRDRSDGESPQIPLRCQERHPHTKAKRNTREQRYKGEKRRLKESQPPCLDKFGCMFLRAPQRGGGRGAGKRRE